ncbi:MAG: hypothetical protein EBX54_06065 [Betaproteobacteria bacterium]|nr:hypothetical protein [Betaproteobacteria bacterium]
MQLRFDRTKSGLTQMLIELQGRSKRCNTRDQCSQEQRTDLDKAGLKFGLHRVKKAVVLGERFAEFTVVIGKDLLGLKPHRIVWFDAGLLYAALDEVASQKREACGIGKPLVPCQSLHVGSGKTAAQIASVVVTHKAITLGYVKQQA